MSNSHVIVKFRVPGQQAVFATQGASYARNDVVVVDGEHGEAMGTVLAGVDAPALAPAGNTVVRQANEADQEQAAQQTEQEREAFAFCKERIQALGLPMKLVAVEFSHAGAQAIFSFSSAERVDFRALVKDVARKLHKRIEMRQIGVRDAARHVGGIGRART